MNYDQIVIAIDGPAGAGKSTVSKLLAQKLRIRYLDTGAMYRCLALKALGAGVSGTEGERAAELLQTLDIRFGTGTPPPVFINDQEVTHLIRTPEIGELASALSQHSPVRKQMVERQKQLVAKGGMVLEGQDVTTVVAPQATLKVYLTASLEERARRRLREFSNANLESSFSDVRQQIEQRDHRDINRDDSPLRVAEDAEVLESAGKSPEAVADELIRLLHQKMNQE